VVVQSMCNTATVDIEATVAQIEKLAHAGCRIVRVAVPNREAARALAKIRAKTDVALVADIHFQHTLAVAAIEAGADKVRINPGNIGGEKNVKSVVDAAVSAGIPIRVGVNSGSLEHELLEKHGGPTAQALVESAAGYVAMMQRLSFDNVVFSIKASGVVATIAACRAFAEKFDYPQHIGITESGTVRTGTIRSSVGIGALLSQGIGDTIRVSLAGDPLEEVRVCREILKSLGLARGPTVLACPTCGRTQMDVSGIAEKVEALVSGMQAHMTIAVMGCVVNGPGEARDADVGVAGGKDGGEVFVKGKVVAKARGDELVEVLMRYVREIAPE